MFTQIETKDEVILIGGDQTDQMPNRCFYFAGLRSEEEIKRMRICFWKRPETPKKIRKKVSELEQLYLEYEVKQNAG